MSRTLKDFGFLGCCLEGFCFGLYSGIFAAYLHFQCHDKSQKNINKARNTVSYALCVLYALCAATMILDSVYYWINSNSSVLYHLTFIQSTVFACGDFVAQSILIYRCWIVWNHGISTVIIPSILAFSCLVTWIVSGSAPPSIVQGRTDFLEWGYILIVTALTLSIAVNALATGLIVFRILKVFRDVKVTADDHILSITGRSTLQRVLFILIESGMALFAIQLTHLVASIVNTDSAFIALQLIIPLHGMLNGITPTIILVRVSMGLSFHDEGSMAEANIGSLHFAHDNPNPMWETRSITIVDQDRSDVDIGIQCDDSDMPMVEREIVELKDGSTATAY